MLMKHYPLRWAQCCVAATTFSLLAVNASASQTVKIGPGDSLDSLARKYHVSKRDIAHVNGISDPEMVLRDGRSIVIPDPPKSVTKPVTIRRSAAVRGDRITIRRGPNENYGRVTLLDHGAPLVVTANAGEWLQVDLATGSSGWVKQEFVALGGAIKSPDFRSASQNSRPNHIASEHIRPRRIAKTVHARKQRVTAKEKRRNERLARISRKRQIARHHHSSKHSVAGRPRHDRPEPAAPQVESDVLRTALAYRGVRYRYGATGGNGFDCSGFTGHVFRKKGVSLPRTAHEQFNKGKKVSAGEMKEGDLVFFHTTRSGISHVGIYAGSGKFVHASSSGGRVRVDRLDSGYYRNRLRGIRRVKETKSKPSPAHKPAPVKAPEPAVSEPASDSTESTSKGGEGSG